MREFDDHYEEEYVYLADMTDTAALVSWGKFPALTTSAPLTFAVIGDTGTGTSDQAALANALDAVIKPRFQCIDSEDASRQVRCVVTGGGGTWRDGQPEKATNGHVNCWGGNQGTHFLVVSIAGPTMTIEPITAAGTPLVVGSRKSSISRTNPRHAVSPSGRGHIRR